MLLEEVFVELGLVNRLSIKMPLSRESVVPSTVIFSICSQQSQVDRARSLVEHHQLRPRLHDTVFISYRIGFISDWPSFYTIPFSFHIGLPSCLHENAPIRYASYRFRVFK